MLSCVFTKGLRAKSYYLLCDMVDVYAPTGGGVCVCVFVFISFILVNALYSFTPISDLLKRVY